MHTLSVEQYIESNSSNSVVYHFMLENPSKCTIRYAKKSAIHKDFYLLPPLLPHMGLAFGRTGPGVMLGMSEDLTARFLQSWPLQSLQAKACHFHGKARRALANAHCHAGTHRDAGPAARERAVPTLGRKHPGHLKTLIITFIFYLWKLCPCYTQLSSC